MAMIGVCIRVRRGAQPDTGINRNKFWHAMGSFMKAPENRALAA